MRIELLYTKYIRFIKYVAECMATTRLACPDDYVQAALLKLCELLDHHTGELSDGYIKQCIRHAMADEYINTMGALSSSTSIKYKAITVKIRYDAGESIEDICQDMHITLYQFHNLMRLIAETNQSLADISVDDVNGLTRKDLLGIDSLTDEERAILVLRLDKCSLENIASNFGKSIKWVWDRLESIREKIKKYVY